MIGFIEAHVNTCGLNIPKPSNIRCESILYLMICILNSGLPPGEANNEAPRPKIHSYSAAEASGPIGLAPPAMPPPPGASPPPRGPRQRPSATGFGLGQPMPQRRAQCLKHIEIQEIHCRFELDWLKSTSPRFFTSSYL